MGWTIDFWHTAPLGGWTSLVLHHLLNLSHDVSKLPCPASASKLSSCKGLVLTLQHGEKYQPSAGRKALSDELQPYVCDQGEPISWRTLTVVEFARYVTPQ